VRRPAADQGDILQNWFTAQVPEGWFCGPPQVTFDQDEILVVGGLRPADAAAAEACDPDGRVAAAACIERFREASREQRMRIAEGAEARFGRKVSWGVTCGAITELFTTASVPVMTRLRMTERSVLDTLIDAGVARSRSEALAWCVRLVGRNESEWIAELRAAFEHVHAVRGKGHASDRPGRRGAGPA
jgi:hypothetical protein